MRRGKLEHWEKTVKGENRERRRKSWKRRERRKKKEGRSEGGSQFLYPYK